ncbi:prepilin-type N-terminal cleavage/methylation domain-containing protein [Anaerotignum sp.]|uniref:prepilin-type N-terminal cleavage/methylation domain-containing protein n=1 Tax=Anaerotignum sp. TaxID=2039241 RepID=UPI00289C695F|nr:prepilin-type N-terminal cleavage/methylation domain-containing protein [Anaerotignum sp.]
MNKILKRKNKKGFTLMEMLIVIGIIAILVAIAIPTFSGANKKAKYAADVANVRSWYAEKLVANMTDDTPLPTKASDYDGPELQYGDITEIIGGTADKFKVTYTPDAVDGDIKVMTFPTPAATPVPKTS